MCVAQFRDYTKAMKTILCKNSQKFSELQNDKNFQIFKNSYKQYKKDDGKIYQTAFFAFDLKEIKKLQKLNNPYAQNHNMPNVAIGVKGGKLKINKNFN